MVVGRSTVTGYDPSVMWIQFVDEASAAEQSQIVEGDQLVSLNGLSVRNLSEVLTAFKATEGREVEIIVRRPRYTLISGRFEHYVRSIDVKDVFEITENGKKP